MIMEEFAERILHLMNERPAFNLVRNTKEFKEIHSYLEWFQ